MFEYDSNRFSVFELLKFELYGLFEDTPKIVQAYVSLNRVDDFLKKVCGLLTRCAGTHRSLLDRPRS